MSISSEYSGWSACNQSLAWDGQALSLNMAGTKRSLYLTADAPNGLLYCSKVVPKGHFDVVGVLRGLRDYRVTTNTSSLAFTIGRVRDFFADIVHALMGSHVDRIGKAITVVGIVVVIAVGNLVGLPALIAQLYVIQVCKLQKRQPREDYYPLGWVGARHVAVGVLSWIPTIAALSAFEPVLDQLLRMIYPIQDSTLPPIEQDIVALMKIPGIGLFCSVYAAIGAPLLEECVFRGLLRDYLTEKPNVKASMLTRACEMFRFRSSKPSLLSGSRLQVILKTSIVFGLCHYSARQGPLNIPVILVTTFIGLVCAILRELTGNLWASTALHATHNTICTLQVHNLIPQITFR